MHTLLFIMSSMKVLQNEPRASQKNKLSTITPRQFQTSVICSLPLVLFLCWCNPQTVFPIRRVGVQLCPAAQWKTLVDVEYRGFRYRLAQMSAWFSLFLTFTRDSHRGKFTLLPLPPLLVLSVPLLQCFASLPLILAMCCIRRFCWLSKRLWLLQHCSMFCLLFHTHLLR